MNDEQRRKLSRRAFLRTIALGGSGALVMAACGGTTEQAGSAGSAGSSAATSAAGGATSGGGAATSAAGGAANGGAATSAAGGATSGATSGGGWTGTITMYAQTYTPNAEKSVVKLQAFRQIADEYQKQHPGITIEFIDLRDAPGYDDSVRVKAAASELYDVFWGQWSNLNSTYPEGIAVDLKPYLDQPNPYMDGKPWREAFNATVLSETADTDGKQYNVNGDFVATAFFYNKKLFDQVGITQPPKTWPELLDASKKLQAANIPAVAHVPLYGWWQRHFLSDFYSKEYEQISGFDKQPGLSALDQAVAINKGLLSPKDPRFLGWWPLFKDFTQYWIQDYLTRPTDDNTAAFQDFLGGRAAMIYEGSWQPNKIRDADPNFQFDSFNFPTLSSDVTQYSTGVVTSNAVGGPSAGFQFAIATPRANKTMEEPGKLDAVVDWMRFFARPQQAEQIINEKGDYIPTLAGAKPKAGAELLVEQANAPLRAIQVGSTTDELGDELQSVFGLYLSGNTSIEDATQQVQDLLDQSAQAYATKNNVDFSQYQ